MGAADQRERGGSRCVLAGLCSDVAAALESSCHLLWTVLAAIGDTESGFGTNMATSSAGAIGYGQFLPATWAAYVQDGTPTTIVTPCRR